MSQILQKFISEAHPLFFQEGYLLMFRGEYRDSHRRGGVYPFLLKR